MQMTARPILPAPKTTVVETADLPGPAAAALPSSAAAAPFRMLASIVSTFVDTVEPTVARFSRRKRLIAVESEGGNIAFYLPSGKRTMLLGIGTKADDAIRRRLSAYKNADVELRLLADNITTASFKIPAAGREFASQIVESRLDRLTPWRPDSILNGFSVAPKPGPDGQFDLEFAATSKQIADAGIERLAEYGLVPSTLGSAAGPIDKRLAVDLFGGKNDTGRRARRRRIAVYAVLGLSVAVLVFLTSLYAVFDSSSQIASLDATLAKARNRMVQATGSTAGREKDFALIATKTPDQARFMLISRLATIIPDSTYLDELDIQADGVRIGGTSTDASGLIKLIEADPAFADAKFAAPVTRQDDGRDRFEISAALTTGPKEVMQ